MSLEERIWKFVATIMNFFKPIRKRKTVLGEVQYSPRTSALTINLFGYRYALNGAGSKRYPLIYINEHPEIYYQAYLLSAGY